MKKSLMALLLLTSLCLSAVTEKFTFSENDIQLELENVILKDVEFHKSDFIEVVYSDKEAIKFEQFPQVLSIRALEKDTKIELYLPQHKQYLYENRDGICTFNNEILNFDADDAFIIISEAGIKVTDYNNGDTVIINDDGIFVNENDEYIRITSTYVSVDGDESIHLDGLLGVVVSTVVKSIANIALSSIGRTPDRIFKFVVNNEDQNSNLHFHRG